MKSIFLKITLAVTLLGIYSCDRESNDPINNNLPANIELDFYSRYPGTDITEFTQWNDKNSTFIHFTDTNGLSSTAIYLYNDWVLTQKEFDKENFLFQLPRKIARAYIGTGVDNENFSNPNSYVIEITRSEIDYKQYEFYFTTTYKDDVYSFNNLANNIVIDENGNLLTHNHSQLNRSVWWYDIGESIQCVRTKYPYATLLGSVNEGGNNVFFILDNKIQKTVTTRRNYNNWEWEQTKYKLDTNTIIPDTVIADMEAYEAKHPDSKFYALYYIENKYGSFYGLMFGDEFYSTTIHSKVE